MSVWKLYHLLCNKVRNKPSKILIDGNEDIKYYRHYKSGTGVEVAALYPNIVYIVWHLLRVYKNI